MRRFTIFYELNKGGILIKKKYTTTQTHESLAMAAWRFYCSKKKLKHVSFVSITAERPKCLTAPFLMEFTKA